MASLALRTLIAVLLLMAGTAHGFKIDTHLWLADHLVAEIEQGHVEFDDGTRIDVDSRVGQSIARYPDAFRIGVLGADLYPDLVAGQMTTHPGLAPRLDVDPDSVPDNVAALASTLGRPFTGAIPGWQTDDWLSFVRDRALGRGRQPTPEIAFAYGYLLHAAMDTWAHSYVNLYTGDLFSITHNQEIAARHTALEIYIKQTHEPYVTPLDGARRAVDVPRSAGEQLRQRVPLDNLSTHAAPTRFVRDTLILNPDVANQYARTPGAQHVYAMWAVWDYAGRSRGDWQPVRQGLDTLLDRAADAVLSADAAWQTADQAKGLAEGAAALALTAKGTAEQTAAASGSAFAGMVGDVLDALNDNPAIDATEATVEQFLGYLPPPMRTAYFQAKNAAMNADKALEQAVAAYQAAAQHSSDAAAKALAAFQNLQLKRGAERAAADARQIAWQAVDTGLDGWRRNIESAVDAYVRAFEETAREIMRGSGNRFRKGANVTWPLKQWATCWGPLFGMPAMPLPPDMAASACQEGLSAYNHARQNLTLLKNNAPFDLLGLGGLKQQIVAFEEHLHEQVRDAMPIAGQLLADAVGPGSEAVPGSASFVAALWDHDVSATDLNAAFAHDSSNQNLPAYASTGAGSVTAMLHRDGLPTGTGRPLPAMLTFAPVRNALAMSRLALLDGAGLNQLARGYGVTASAYDDGVPAYPADARPGDVLIGAIRSIDGNHQWQPVAPPLPRQVIGQSQSNLADLECRRFGYPADGNYGPDACPKDAAAASTPALSGWLERKHGFRLWLDPVLRARVFDRLFAGPLSLAVCERLGSSVSFYGGLGCGDGEPYPPSPASAYSVASLTEAQLQRRPQGPVQTPAGGRGASPKRTAPPPDAVKGGPVPTQALDADRAKAAEPVSKDVAPSPSRRPPPATPIRRAPDPDPKAAARREPSSRQR